MTDPFDTAGLRDQVLQTWARSANRFREDANAEEELARGSYRDRLIVELAQNAADAAARAGVSGRLLLRLSQETTGWMLTAANTGAPLDAVGVAALASLRASAKRGHASEVGHFGVGFAAVVAVSDELSVLSGSGGVRFSRADTLAAVRELGEQHPELAAELAARDEQVPIVRMVWPTHGEIPPGYQTAVRLQLRDQVSLSSVREQLQTVGDTLLLALPSLSEVVVEIAGEPSARWADPLARWHIHACAGEFTPQELSDRPTEDQERRSWSLTWAFPREGSEREAWPQVVHAPTPTDDRLPWPAVLIARFPVDSSRRRIVPGRATTAVIAAAAREFAVALAELTAAGEPIAGLIPVGLPAGEIDAALREAVLAQLPSHPILPAASGEPGEPGKPGGVRPADALAVAGPLGGDPVAMAELGQWLAGLVCTQAVPMAALRAAGVEVVGPADLLDRLGRPSEPERWRELYRVLLPHLGDPAVREALTTVSVPLVDGRLHVGVRGVYLLSGPESVDLAAVRALALPIVHPQAAHPLLERLGAQVATPRSLLEDPAVRAAVAGELDDLGDAWFEDSAEGSTTPTQAVLQLVRSAVQTGELNPGDLPWLGELLLEDAVGEQVPAGALALPGSSASQLFDADVIGVVAEDLVAAWGAQTLRALGVLDGPAVLAGTEVVLDSLALADEDLDPGDPACVDGFADWAEQVRQRCGGADLVVVPDLQVVADLDAVDPERWPQLVAQLVREPQTYAALVQPCRVLADGVPTSVRSYTAWWLRDALTDGELPFADPEADGAWGEVLPAPPSWLAEAKPQVRKALGLIGSVADVEAADLPGMLEQLSGRVTSVGVWLSLWARLSEVSADDLALPAPDQLAALVDGRIEVQPGDQVVVADSPMWAQRLDLGALVIAPPGRGLALAEVLDVAYAPQESAGEVCEKGELAGRLAPVPAEALALSGGISHWCEHEELAVDDEPVDWWVDPASPGGGAGQVHACTMAGLAEALAWASGQWARRSVIAAALLEPERLDALLIEESFGA